MHVARAWSAVAAAIATLTTVVGFSLVVGAAPAAATEIHSCEFGTGQVFDVQWSINGSNLTVSSMDYPFSNYGMFYPNGSPTRFDSTTLASTDYFKFFDSTTVAGTLGLELFSSNGTLLGVVDDTGSFQAIGNGFIFYVGDGNWGTLLTTTEGFHYGDGTTFSATNTSPSTADALAFTSCASTPVSAPVIAAASPGAGKVGTPYSAFTIPATGGGTLAFAVTNGSLPAGLTLDPATGKISGTPTAPGASTFTVTVTGTTGSTSVVYTITIDPSGLPATGTDPLLPATIALAALLSGIALIGIRRRRATH